MKELKELANETLINALNFVNESGEFLQDEIPIVIQELLRWKLAEGAFVSLFWTVIIFLVFKFRKKMWNILPDTDSYDNLKGKEPVSSLFFCFGFLLITIIGSTIWVSHMLRVVKILVAPRVYLIEYASQLVNGY